MSARGRPDFFGDVAYERPEAMHDFIFDPEKWQAPGAETYAEVGRRAYAELIRIAEANDGKSVVVVSHGVTILCLLSRILGIGLGDKEHLPICGNTGVTLLHFESGAFSPVFINDVSHLSALGMKPWQKTPDMRGESLIHVRTRDTTSAAIRRVARRARESQRLPPRSRIMPPRCGTMSTTTRL